MERWLSCRWVRRFESGGCTASQFAAGVIEDWSLSISPGDYLEAFRSWAVAPFPGAVELVQETKASVRVGCLSNTNAVHWEGRVSSWGLAELFEFPIVSFRVGRIKPDREMFDLAVRTVGRPGEEILFLDDSRLNVQAAREAGMKSALVRGVEEARAALRCAGVAGLSNPQQEQRSQPGSF